MAKTTLSLALVIAIGQLTTLSSAQTAPTRKMTQAPAQAPVGALQTLGAANTPPAAASSSPAASSNEASGGSAAVQGVPQAPPNQVNSATTAPPTTATIGVQPAVSAPPPTVGDQPEPLVGTLAPMDANQGQTQAPPTEPRTYEHRFTLSLDLANVLWRTNRGYDLFSSNDAAWRIGIGAGYDILKLPSRMILALEVGAMLEPGQSMTSDSGLLGNSLSGSVSASTLLLGGSLRWALTPWLAPYGRLQLFTSRLAVDIQTTASNVTAGSTGGEWSYHRWAEGGALGAGVMLNLPPRSPVNVGVLLEGGYWLQQSIDVVLEGNPPPGSIATSGARLGSLGNSGPYFRLAGLMRF